MVNNHIRGLATTEISKTTCAGNARSQLVLARSVWTSDKHLSSPVSSSGQAFLSYFPLTFRGSVKGAKPPVGSGLEILSATVGDHHPDYASTRYSRVWLYSRCSSVLSLTSLHTYHGVSHQGKSPKY